MRFALIGPFPPYRGGIAHFSEALRRGLGGRGHAVEAVTFSRQYPGLLFPGTTQYEPDGRPVGAERLLDTIGPRSWWKTARHVIEREPDAAVFQFWMPFLGPSYGVVARRLRKAGVPVLAVVHNALPHERRPGDRALARYFLRACDGFVVMSESVRRDLQNLGVEAPVRRVRHPVYEHFGEARPRAEARAALGLPTDAPVLLFFGFVRRYKGLHVLLDAMPRVLARLPEARLVVAGEFYDDEGRCRRQAAPLGKAVRFDAAYIPSEAVGTYFGAADVVVQPYVSATQSGVAQIAFHFERPLVTTNVGGLAETVPPDAGLVVPPEDPAALADAVARFFEERMAGADEGGDGLPGLADQLFLEGDALIAREDRRPGADLTVTIPEQARTARDLEPALLPLADLAAQPTEGLHEESLDVVRLEAARFGPLHVLADALNPACIHGVGGERAIVEQVLREAQQRAIDTLIEEKVQVQEFYKLVKDEKVSAEEIDEQIDRLRYRAGEYARGDERGTPADPAFALLLALLALGPLLALLALRPLRPFHAVERVHGVRRSHDRLARQKGCAGDPDLQPALIAGERFAEIQIHRNVAVIRREIQDDQFIADLLAVDFSVVEPKRQVHRFIDRLTIMPQYTLVGESS